MRVYISRWKAFAYSGTSFLSQNYPKDIEVAAFQSRYSKQDLAIQTHLENQRERKRRKPTRTVFSIKQIQLYFSLFTLKTKYIRMVNILSAF